jgi:hypothetical protein
VSRPQRIAAAVLLVSALVVAFIAKPVHVDDANFLRLAEGAARDPWRPHAIAINWLGVTEPAFGVLSNPPGVAYWLAPVRNQPEWLMHASMLPWLALALYGVFQLGEAFGVRGERALLVLGTAPVFALCAQSLTPDLPLAACAFAGIAGFARSEKRAWAWALLAGCAVLFRYSGLCVLPLVLLLGVMRGRPLAAVPVLAPAVLLFAHDLAAYGHVHALAMVGFQGISNTSWEMYGKLVAALGTLGGACLLPVLSWRLRALPFALLAAVLSHVACGYALHTPLQLWPTVLFCAAGGAAFALLRLRDRDDVFLAVWALGGLAFLLTLRFVATRYWLLFLPPLVLAALRREPSIARLTMAVTLSTFLAFGLSLDDYGFARAYRDAARDLARGGPGVFAGHWGFQYYLEQAGWRPLEAGEPLPAKLAIAPAAWPQLPADSPCVTELARRTLPAHAWLPRVHSRTGAANFHASLLSGLPVLDAFAPWTFSSDPYDQIIVLAPCS